MAVRTYKWKIYVGTGIELLVLFVISIIATLVDDSVKNIVAKSVNNVLRIYAILLNSLLTPRNYERSLVFSWNY